MTRSDTEHHSQRPRLEIFYARQSEASGGYLLLHYESFVERAIRSVLDQCRHDCEVVAVDEGSTDGSWDVISRSGVTPSGSTIAAQGSRAYLALTRPGRRSSCSSTLTMSSNPVRSVRLSTASTQASQSFNSSHADRRRRQCNCWRAFVT
jgi:hypothetical protein